MPSSVRSKPAIFKRFPFSATIKTAPPAARLTFATLSLGSTNLAMPPTAFKFRQLKPVSPSPPFSLANSVNPSIFSRLVNAGTAMALTSFENSGMSHKSSVVGDFQGVTSRAYLCVKLDCVLIFNARERGFSDFIIRKLAKHRGQNAFHFVENVVLSRKRHFEVELIELARRTVGARVLVAEAGRDLEIAVETACHKQLFILLRRLRKRVKFAGVQARRHNKVARLRADSSKWCRDFQKTRSVILRLSDDITGAENDFVSTSGLRKSKNGTSSACPRATSKSNFKKGKFGAFAENFHSVGLISLNPSACRGWGFRAE